MGIKEIGYFEKGISFWMQNPFKTGSNIWRPGPGQRIHTLEVYPASLTLNTIRMTLSVITVRVLVILFTTEILKSNRTYTWLLMRKNSCRQPTFLYLFVPTCVVTVSKSHHEFTLGFTSFPEWLKQRQTCVCSESSSLHEVILNNLI